jgi:hypothetical protein
MFSSGPQSPMYLADFVLSPYDIMRALLPIATAALVLASGVHGATRKADAGQDAQINLYTFATEKCSGQPFTAPYKMKQGECVDITQARSVRPRFDPAHLDWFEETNALRLKCRVQTFSDRGCPNGNVTDAYDLSYDGSLPDDLEHCLMSNQQQWQESGKVYKNTISSAKLVCDNVEESQLLCSRLYALTTWAIDTINGSPTSEVKRVTLTGSLSVSKPTKAAVEKRGFEFTKGSTTKDVWMQHPWGHSPLCYLCYTKKPHEYQKVECRAGIKYVTNCGPEPLGWSDTIEAYDISSSDSEEDHPRLYIELQQKKSWHTPVKFDHPFLDGKKACADAEWEKRGQIGKDYIKIQKVHICDGEDPKRQWIGPPETSEPKKKLNQTTPRQNVASPALSAAEMRRHDQL